LKEDARTRENMERVKGLFVALLASHSKQDKKEKELSGNASGHRQGSSKAVKQKRDVRPVSVKAEKKSGSQDARSQREALSSNEISSKQISPVRQDVDGKYQKKSRKRAKNAMPKVSKSRDAMIISDREEKKWFKLLERQPISHIYKIRTAEISKERRDAKPW